jgi:hypothetical protein
VKSIFSPSDHEELQRRIDALTPESRRRWGRMTPHQAVCHLNDFAKAILGDRPIPPRQVGARLRLVRFIAFTSPLPWPKGVRTSPEINAEMGGTRPAEFAADVAELKALLARYAAMDVQSLDHYSWGRMSRGVLGRYGYRHVDHHLRQFGV